MKETKTAKGVPDCPTLLHYIARVLLRKDPSLVSFIDDMPHLGRIGLEEIAAGRHIEEKVLHGNVTAHITGHRLLPDDAAVLHFQDGARFVV